MELNMKCAEWANLNRNARTLKKNLELKKKKKSSSLSTDDQLTLYCLEIVGNGKVNSKIACLSSDQIVRLYDINSLRQLSSIRPESKAENTLNQIGFFKQTENMLFGCENGGKLKCWDLRSSSEDAKESICIEYNHLGKREFLSADINANDQLIAIGTNLNVDDSLVVLFDIRFTDKYLYKFCESHSNDVTQIKFNPSHASKFSSASSDGLVCLYDLDQKPDPEEQQTSKSSDNDSEHSDDESDTNSDLESDEDPDLMEQVLNANSCINKIGYLSSSNDSNVDRLFAITATNDLFVWDLNSYDVVFKKETKNKNQLDETVELDEEDYYFDCFYLDGGLIVCKGDKTGQISLFNEDKLVYDSTKNERDRCHRDLVRCSYWNREFLFTGGEDGFLYKWNLTKLSANANDTKNLKRENQNNDTNDSQDSPSDSDQHQIKTNAKNKKKKFTNKKFNKKQNLNKNFK